MSNNKESDRVDSHAIDRFENLVLELNRAVLQFGLFLPPLVITIEEIDKGLAILQSLLGD